MLKRIIGLSLLCITGNAFANIVVNTTEDEFDSTTPNEMCSLREAVALVNMTGSDAVIPAAGFGGCIADGNTPVIVLEAGETYKVTDNFSENEIKIKKSLSINSLSDTNLEDPGENNAVIEYVGKTPARLFSIDDGNPDISNLTVNFNEVDFIGCRVVSADEVCDAQGGIIFNREGLSINYARLQQGFAVSGGAIYNEGIANSGDTQQSAGLLTLKNVYFSDNKAGQGAAIYSAEPRYAINASVFRDNEATADKGSVVFANSSGSIIDQSSQFSRSCSALTGNICNSTFFDNQAFAANLLDGMVLNNNTIIRNKSGVYLDSVGSAANLSNSIVAENGQADCMQSPTNKAVTNNVLYKTGDCGLGELDNPNRKLGNAATDKLIAGDSTEGACDKPPATGLLCPFRTEKGTFNGFFKPRLLVAYTKLSDSPIVNRGRVFNDGNTTSSLACESTDQRGESRETVVLCDIGSVELLIEDKGKIGQDILFGEVANIDLIDSLGDGELWPKENCDDVFKDSVGFQAGTVWQAGCMRFVEGKEASKGELIISSDGLLKYKAFSDFHGSDNFSIDVVTTTSRFSQGANDRTVTLRGTIVQEPPDTFEDKTVNVSGGSIGLFGLFGLFGLVWARRRLQGE